MELQNKLFYNLITIIRSDQRRFLNMKKIWVASTILILIFLVGCSGLPRKLIRTADKEMSFFIAENTHITEAGLYLEPLLIDQFQVAEEKWCLTYEIGHLLWFSTLWEKQERDWVQTEIRPYVENCDWIR